MKKIETIIIILAICGFVLLAFGLISSEMSNNITTNNTTNNTNVTCINLTNNTTENVEISNNNHGSSQSKSDSNKVPSDIYSRWDTDGDGILSSSEMDVHDKSLGQGKYYSGHENMKDSITTYPE